MNSLKQLFGGNIRQFGMVFALVALIIFFQISTSLKGGGQFWTDGSVLSPSNFQNLVNGYAYVLVLAIGMVMVIIMGHIDLSVGSVAAFVGIVVALAMRDWGIPWWVGIVLGLAVGALAGAWQGFWVAYVGIPAFITTLAGMMIFRGLNQVFGKQNTISVPQEFTFIGNGYLPDGMANAPFNLPTIALGLIAVAFLIFSTFRRRSRNSRSGSANAPMWADMTRVIIMSVVILAVMYLFATGRPGTSFPVAGIIVVVLVIIYQFVTSKTVAGRAIYAVGGNRQAARLSGIDDKKVDFFVMMNMSMLAAVAGMMFVARSQGSGPLDGTSWELDAIAAVFIGGAAVSGGVGTVMGSIIGALVMAVLNNGLQLMSAPTSTTYVVKGLVLLLAVAFDVWSKRQGKPSLIGAMQKAIAGNKTSDPAVPAPAPVGGAADAETPGLKNPAAEADKTN
ncbi:sugar ABC transporter permease [Galactobacter valiniphilus]|uniref:Xylose transport system permease protein XylH n=1 Tax=Galactobacter valiniphilus TaxID=2676122 RepID=A0A399JEB0_9MICC|nr:multiple monosaccharide ABC transporter permease [Galactobacter valiniphilus]RII42422.1 sugar ABC transporter permease [Galactobacter valiniphilus]